MHPADAERLARAISAAGSFAFVQVLGSGAFKHAFKVEVAGIPKTLKVYKSLAAAQDARTQREIDAIARCNHPGVVKFEGLKRWVDGGQEYAFSVEEYLAGGSLEDKLQSAGLLQPVDLLKLGAALIEVISHLQERNLVHRDLKPANIMFRGTTEPVVIDFGLVRDLSAASLTHTWAPQGPCSPFFAAPEQLKNQKDMIDWRTDQFALALVLAIAGTGVHPFATSQDVYETVSNVGKRQAPTPVFMQWANGVGLTCLPRMLSPWPVHRYRTPRELRDAWAGQQVS
jgi:serine/threonine protein kinase